MGESIFQARSGVLVDLGEVDEGKDACSERLSIVIPDRFPLAIGGRKVRSNLQVPTERVSWLDVCTCRLGNPMERKAVSQNPSRPFGVPHLSIKRARPTQFYVQTVVNTPGRISQ